LKGSHFGTNEVIEAEPQAVLNTLTKDDFQNAFKNGRSACEQRIRSEGHYFENDGGQ
jgi:hypothetical protein